MVVIGQWVALDDGTDGLVTETDLAGRIPRLRVEQRHFPWSDTVLRDLWVWPANVVGDGMPHVTPLTIVPMMGTIEA